jgi:hypothetical protein
METAQRNDERGGSREPVTDGKLDLESWEQLFYGEIDGERRKLVLAKIRGEERSFGRSQQKQDY